MPQHASFQHLAGFLNQVSKSGDLPSSVPPSLVFSKAGLEVGGYLWGQDLWHKKQRTIVIQKMTPVSVANRGDDFIERTPMSGQVMRIFAEAASAPWRLVGDFHSHPLLNVSRAQIEKTRLFEPSRQDRKADPQLPGMEVNLIMSVGFKKRTDKPERQPLSPNASHRQIADLNIWLCAHWPSRQTRKADPMLELDLPPS